MRNEPTIFRSERLELEYLAAYDTVLRSWPVPYESRLVDTRFGGTHVLSCGQGAGTPLVLLPGAGVSATMWRPNIAALSAGRVVHAVDTFWDLGKAAPRRYPANYADAGAWFCDLVAALGCERVDLAGLSYGGFLALRFAIDEPARVRRLVVLAPAASLSGLSIKFFVNALSSVLVPTRPRWLCQAMLRWATSTPVADDLRDQWVAGLRAMRINSPIQRIPPVVLADAELRQVRAPALLIQGEREWTCRDPAGGMLRFRHLVPGGQTALIRGAGHIVSLDRPEEVSARMLAHLDAG